MSSYEYLLSDISTIKGIGTKIGKLFRKKNINTIFDLLWNLPRDFVDRSNVYPINELQVGKIQTVTVVVKKYNFPRIRNLPNKVICEDETGKLDCIFFNSYEGYIKKILPIGKEVTISGKIKYFRNKYQLTNPKYISEDSSIIKQKHNSYSLTEGISEKVYNKIIFQIIKNAIQFLCDQYIINGSIEKKDIISSVSKFMINENNNLDKKIEYIIKTPKKSVIPRSEKQKKYVSALRSSDIIISTGPAGTGKTFLSVAVALTMLLDKKIDIDTIIDIENRK